MEILQLLGVALGLATLAGVNLYLTVFVTGLAINMGWVQLAPAYEKLAVLGDPTILTVAGVLFTLEFFADKIPWVDSLWDTVHTLIRPVGGALLSLQVLGTANPVLDVIIALMGGSVSLGTHTLKAGTRLLVNSSPEPVSNVALSVTEDAAVVGGLVLTAVNPALMFVVVILLTAFVIWLAPQAFGFFSVRFAFLWNKLIAPSEVEAPDLGPSLPAEADIRLAEALEKADLPLSSIAWALPGYAERVSGVPHNKSGHLVALRDATPRLVFIPKKRSVAPVIMDCEGYKLCQESTFLAERLTFYSLSKKPKFTFSFYRWQGPLVREAARRFDHILNPQSDTGSSEEREPTKDILLAVD